MSDYLSPDPAWLAHVEQEFTRLRDGTADYGARSSYSRILEQITELRHAIACAHAGGCEGQRITPESY